MAVLRRNGSQGESSFAKSSLPQFDFDDTEKNELLDQLAALEERIAQEENVLGEASAMQEQLEGHVGGLAHAVERAQAELRERRARFADEAQRQQEEEERRLISRRCTRKQTIHDVDDHIPEEMQKELDELHAEIAQLQDRHESLQQALQQATEALHAASERPPSSDATADAGGCSNHAARAEAYELERDIERLARIEAKRMEEHRRRVGELREEIDYVEAHGRDERWVLREDLQSAIADGEVLESEITHAKAEIERALERLQRQESALREAVNKAENAAATRLTHRRCQMRELKHQRVSLQKATDAVRRFIDNDEKPKQSKAVTITTTTEAPQTGAEIVASNWETKSPIGRARKTLLDEMLDANSPDTEQIRNSSFSLQPEDKDQVLPKKKKMTLFDEMQGTQSQGRASRDEMKVNGAASVAPVHSGSTNSKAQLEFLSVSLDKTSGVTLGIAVDQDLLITAIEDEGLVASWNGTHSLSSVCAGYQIVEVNGKVDVKKMIKQLKAHRPMEMKLQWKGLNKRPALNRMRSSNLRRARCSNLGTYNYTGAVRINLDDDDDNESIASSGSGRPSCNKFGASMLSGGGLSVIGEGSTMAGDSSSRCSSNAGDPFLAASHDVERASFGYDSLKRHFSLDDADDIATLAEEHAQNRSLEISYDALEKMGRQSSAAKSRSSALEPEEQRLDTSGEMASPLTKARHSIEWCYDHLDVGEAVAAVAVEAKRSSSSLEHKMPPKAVEDDAKPCTLARNKLEVLANALASD